LVGLHTDLPYCGGELELVYEYADYDLQNERAQATPIGIGK